MEERYAPKSLLLKDIAMRLEDSLSSGGGLLEEVGFQKSGEKGKCLFYYRKEKGIL